MYLKIGGAVRPFVEADIEPTYQFFYDGLRRLFKIGVTARITGRIVLEDPSQGNMTTAIDLLGSQLKQPRPDIVLLEDDGATPTAFVFRAADCILGPDILEANLPSNAGKVYATSQPYEATFYAEILATSEANPIIEFRETVDDSGSGGWERVFVGGAINPPEEQIGQQYATYRYIQQGSAVGLFSYPPIPPPLWPGALKRPRPRVARESADTLGAVRPTNFRISWAYEFESNYELFGEPHTFTR